MASLFGLGGRTADLLAKRRAPWALSLPHTESQMARGRARLAMRRSREMARPGIEPGTPRFSVVCSTN
jgi:hypothetical protein